MNKVNYGTYSEMQHGYFVISTHVSRDFTDSVYTRLVGV